MPESHPTLPRETKTAILRRLLSRKTGANLAALQSATGWQPHSVRAALSGLLSRSRLSVPSVMNRSCQRQMQVFDLPVAALIAIVPSPSSLNRMIRARQTCFCRLRGAATIACNRKRSAKDTVKEIPVRIRLNRTFWVQWESQIGLF